MRYWFRDIAVFIGVLREMKEEVLMGKLNVLHHNSLTEHEETHKLWSV
jgi:hypothetical protein